MIKLAGNITEFKWSTSEQLYPFEKNSNGESLYCKEISYSGLTLGTWNAYSIPFLPSRTKLFRTEGWYTNGTGNNTFPIMFCNPGTGNDSYQSGYFFADGAVYIWGYNYGGGTHTCTIRYIYSK